MKTPKPSRVGAGSLSGRYIAIILLLGGLLYVYADSGGWGVERRRLKDSAAQRRRLGV